MKGKRILAWLLCAVMLMAFMPVTSFASTGYFGGDGRKDNPYIISDAAGLEQMANDINSGENSAAYFKLANDIDLSDVTSFTPIGTKGNPFKGTFDGNSKIIYNLTINTSQQYSGFFGMIEGATIKNLGLDNVTVNGTGSSAKDIGGLVGNAKGGDTIERCYVTGSVTGYAGIAGIVASTHGYNNPTTIKNCYARVSLTRNSGVGDTAGIAGWNYSSSVKIENCYSACTGELRPIAGWSDSSPVDNSNFSNTYFDKTLSPNFSEEGGRTELGKTSDELKTKSTYTSWDFDSVWVINSTKNGGYPYLKGLVPSLTGAPSSISVTVTDKDKVPVTNAAVSIKDSSDNTTALSHEGNGVYSGTVTTANASYTVIVNGNSVGTITQTGSNAASVTVEIDNSSTDTADWLNTAGNTLYLGSIKVTADNASNIIGSYKGSDITGSASFKVENGVPTLYLDGVTIKDGYKEQNYGGSGVGYYYNIYGIYYEPAGKDKLKIKLSRVNAVEPEDYIDDTYKTSRTYGIKLEKNCTDFLLEGDNSAKLSIASKYRALWGVDTYDYSCDISIIGGEYKITTSGTDTSSEGIYNLGSLEIENAKVNIVSASDRGIWMINYDSSDAITSIKGSEVTIDAGEESSKKCDGILSENNVVIENSSVNIECNGIGIEVFGGKSLTVSGADTVLSAKSSGSEVEEGYEYKTSAILLEGEGGYEDYLPGIGDFTLDDGLAVTTPAGGKIDIIDYQYKSVIGADNSYAREVVIEAPTEHCVCGTKGCTSHTGTVKHSEDTNLNLKNISSGDTLTEGAYYLSDDLTLAGAMQLNIQGTVTICLNGKTLGAKIVPKENAVLNICDCRGDGKIKNTDGHVIYYESNNATVNIYGGTLESNYAGPAMNTIVDANKVTGNSLNLYGGKVTCCGDSSAIGSFNLTVSLYGGTVDSANNNVMMATGGTINLCGNTAFAVPAGYDTIKVTAKNLIDAEGYTGDGSISIYCDSLYGSVEENNVIVKNITGDTAGKFTLSSRNSGFALKRAESSLVYTRVYTVTFDANGGSGTMASVSGLCGEYELPECTFTAPVGMKFKAWSVSGSLYQPGNKITVSADTAVTAVWTNIEKTTVTVNETVQTFGYDSLAKSFTVSANVEGGFNVKYQKDGSDIASPTDAGKYDVIIERAEDDIYKAYSKTVTGGLVITPKNITGATVGSFTEMTYNGSAQTPKATVTIDGLTATGTWSEVTNVADKTTFTANGNFTGTIEKSPGMAKLSVTVPTVASKVYNGSLQKADISETDYYTVTENLGGTAVGSYDVKLTLKDKDNYRWSEKDDTVSEITLKFEITSVANDWTTTPSIIGWTYGETANKPKCAAKFGDVKVEYKEATAEDGTYSETVPTAAGNYKARFTVDGTGNYSGLSKEINFSIAKANANVTAPTARTGLVYDGTAQALTTGGSAVGGEILYSATENGTYTSDVITGINAGNYEVWYKVLGDSNHKDTTPVKISVSIARASQSAPETPAAVSETIKGKADGKITGVDSSMEYKADSASTYTAVDGDAISNLPAGKYLVRYKEKDNYFAGSDKTVEIAAGEMITVTFEANGGTAVDSKTCEYNRTVTAPAEPTKDGYEFVGWFADSSLETEWDFDNDKLTENKTLYAKWVQGTVSKDEENIDEVTADGLNDVAKAEKTDILLAVQVQENSKDNVIQTAIRDITDAPANFGFYDITLNKSTGGTVSEASSVIEIKLPYDFTRKQNIKVYRYHNGNVLELEQLTERNAVKPYADGKCFADTANSCIYIYSSKFSTYSVAYDTVSSSGSGRGASRYTVSFETNGGSKLSSQTVTENTAMKEPTAPTKENFDFDGWYSDKELKTKYDFSAKVTKSFTLYAKWTEKDDSENQFILTIGKKDAQVWGKTVTNDVAPQIVKDRTMLPARFVAENLGAKVEWDGEKQLVTITGKNEKNEDVTILITIGSDTAKVNGENVKLDSPAFIENGRTYTPVRFISEELGASVEWDEATQQVIITKALASEEK